MKLKLTPMQLNRRIVEIMTVITILIIIALIVVFNCHFIDVIKNAPTESRLSFAVNPLIASIKRSLIISNIEWGFMAFSLSYILWKRNTAVLLPVGFIMSLLACFVAGDFSNMLSVVTITITVLWLIEGIKYYYDRNKKRNNAMKEQ
jgi:hypothetical protein